MLSPNAVGSIDAIEYLSGARRPLAGYQGGKSVAPFCSFLGIGVGADRVGGSVGKGVGRQVIHDRATLGSKVPKVLLEYVAFKLVRSIKF